MISAPPVSSLVLFTDLDGTLLDHHTYAPDDARKALHLLAVQNVPVIFCSSKTFAEQFFLQKQLGLVQPFIFENGSAVAIPDAFFPHSILKTINFSGFENGYHIYSLAQTDTGCIHVVLSGFPDLVGFKNASISNLEAATGLTGEALQRARDRRYTETLPYAPHAVKIKLLTRQLTAQGLTLSRGGRFYTIQSATVNKGKAVFWLAQIFKRVMGKVPVLAAVGDSPNDLSMLEAVDYPFLVQKPDKHWTDSALHNLQKVKGVGPKGFLETVRILLDKPRI